MRFLYPVEGPGAAGDIDTDDVDTDHVDTDGVDMDGVDLETAYAIPAPVGGEPHVRVNFVVSVDGAVELGGRSRPLSSKADQKVLRAIRRLADVIVVGAGTVRAEGYGRVQIGTGRQETGTGTGTESAPAPRIIILSRSLDLDVSLPVFTQNTVRPLVLTSAAAPTDRRKSLGAVAEVVVLGQDEVHPSEVVATLAERGFRRILCEGGPTVFSAFVAAGIVDELCVTVSPIIAGPAHSRIVSGPAWDTVRPLTLVHVLEHAGTLFPRYRCS